MSAFYDYTGIVYKVMPVQTFSSGFTKRDLVLTDDDGANSRYPARIPFTFKKDNCAMLDNVREGQRVKVRFAIDGREWTNPQGQTKFFTDLTGFKIEPADGAEAPSMPEPPPAPDGIADISADDDDLPF
jgi:hypothetical protein